MKTRITFILILITIIVFVSKTAQATNLNLILKLDNNKILLCEPIRLTLILQNSSKEEVQINFLISDVLSLYSSYEGQPFNLCSRSSTLDGSTFVRMRLPAGETITDSGDELFFLIHNNSSKKPEFVFNKKGKYALKAVLHVDSELLESDIIQVEVSEPPQEEIDALNLITKKEASIIIMGWDYRKENTLVLQELVGKYPKSIYADHAYFSLGIYFKRKSFSKRSDEKDPAFKSFESFLKVSERIPALKTRALIRQAQLIKLYPELKERVDIPKLIEELEKRSDIAKEIGMEKESSELQEELEKNIKPTSNK